MARLNDQMYSRLEATIANWTKEVTSAHGVLTEQITSARDQLDRLGASLANGSDESTTLERARTEIQSLRATLREREAAAAEVARRAKALAGEKRALAEQLTAIGASKGKAARREEALEAELATLKKEEALLRNALEKKSAQEDTLSGKLAHAHGEAETAQTQARDLEESLAVLQRDLEVVQASSSRAEEGQNLLEDEVARLKTIEEEQSGRLKIHEEERVAGLKTFEEEQGALRRALEEKTEAHDALALAFGEAQSATEAQAAELCGVETRLAETHRALQQSKENSIQEREAVRSELDGIVIAKHTLEKVLAKEKGLNKTLAQSLQQCEEEIGCLRGMAWEMASQKSALDGAVSELRGELREAAEYLDISQGHCANLEESIAVLQRDVEAYRTALEQAEAARAESDARRASLAVELAQAVDGLEGAREEAASTLSALGSEQGARAEVQRRLEESEKSLDAANAELQKERECLRETEFNLDQATHALAELESRMGSLQEQSDSERERLDLALEQARTNKNTAESELTAVRANLRQLTVQLRERDSEATSAKHKSERFEELLKCVREQAESEKVSMHAEVDSLRNQIRAAAASFEGSKSENATLCALLRDRESAISQVARKITQVEENSSVVRSELAALQKREAVSSAENETLLAELDAAAAKERAATLEAARLRADVDGLQVRVREYEDAARVEKMRTIQLLKSTVDSLQGGMTQLNAGPPGLGWVSTAETALAPAAAAAPTAPEESGNGNVYGNGGGSGSVGGGVNDGVSGSVKDVHSLQDDQRSDTLDFRR